VRVGDEGHELKAVFGGEFYVSRVDNLRCITEELFN
jgi:hypothetical protein